jgi:hypothetical protein
MKCPTFALSRGQAPLPTSHLQPHHASSFIKIQSFEEMKEYAQNNTFSNNQLDAIQGKIA